VHRAVKTEQDCLKKLLKTRDKSMKNIEKSLLKTVLTTRRMFEVHDEFEIG